MNRIGQWVWRVLRYIGRVLLIVIGLSVAVGVSFLFTGGLGFQAYSDRMLWVGVVTTLVGGFAAIAASAKERTERTRASKGNHSEAQKPDKEDVSEKQQVRSRYPRKDTFRYELVFHFWLIGALCIAISALVSILGG